MAKVIKKMNLSAESSTEVNEAVLKGTPENPYTQLEIQQLQTQGTWNGGYVEGEGYVVPMFAGFVNDSENGSGSGVLESPIVAKANSYLGKNENDHTELILSWLSAVGVNSTTYVVVDEETGVSKTKVTEPWCASFVSAVYRESVQGGANSARVSDWATWGRSVNNPKPGDVAIFAGVSHCGIVTAVTPNSVTVIYGNSGLDNVTDSTLGRQAFRDFRRNN